jgi:fumarate reductase subunit D
MSAYQSVNVFSQQNQMAEDSQQQNTTPLNLEENEAIQDLFEQKVNELNTIISQQQSQINDLVTKCNKYNLYITNNEKTLNDKQAKKITEKFKNVCHNADNSKKMWTAVIISVVVVLFMSTFTVGWIDKWLDNRNVDLFSTSDKTNELLLLLIQFLFVFVFVLAITHA